MARFLSQDEIDKLLDVIDEKEYEEGTPEFEKELDKLKGIDLRDRIFGANPSEIMQCVEKVREKYLSTIKEFKTFEKHYNNLKEIIQEQPENLI